MKVNVLLLGPIGVGKTFSVRTFLAAGKEVFVLSVEPGIEATLGDIPCEKGLHWKFIPPAVIDWDTMERSARRLNELQMDALAKLPATDKRDFDQYLQVYATCADFKCDRCEEDFGAVDNWDDNRVFVLDGLSNLSRMASLFVTGSKPIRTLPETGAVQDLIRSLLKKLTGDTKCSFCLLAHVEREENPLTGGTIITVATIGKKLAPDIPKDFDEVILAQREGTNFYWTTNDPRVDLKARRLPYADNIKPDFSQLFPAEVVKIAPPKAARTHK